MNDKLEFRFSWTKKDPEGGFRTSKGDTIEEVMSQMASLEGAIRLTEGEQGKPVSTQPTAPQAFPVSVCPIHSVEMKARQGKYGTFYSHYVGVVPNGKWCNGH